MKHWILVKKHTVLIRDISGLLTCGVLFPPCGNLTSVFTPFSQKQATLLASHFLKNLIEAMWLAR